MSWNACIVRIQRKGKTESFLVNADKFTIGRSPECDFIVVDNQVSRKHLGVLIRSGQLYLKDLNSANGSKMGSVKIPSDNVVPHKQGEAIRLGTADLQIYLEYMEKKVDAKNLDDDGLPEDQVTKVQHFLMSSQARSKALFDEYENLVKEFKEYSKSETERLINEATQRAEKIITDGDLQSRAQISSASDECVRLLTKTQLESQNLIQDSEATKQSILNNADEMAKTILAETNDKIRALSEMAEQDLKAKILHDTQAAEEQTNQILITAEEKARHLVAEATMQTDQIRSQADSQALQLIAEATNKAHILVSEAEKQVQTVTQKVLEAAQTEAAKAILDATEKAKTLVAISEAQALQLRTESEASTKKSLAEANLAAKIAVEQAKEATANALKTTSESNALAAETIRNAEAQALKQTTEATDRARQLVHDAESKANQLSQESERTASNLLRDVQVQVDALYEKFEAHKKEELARVVRDQEQYKTQVLLASQIEQQKHKETYDIKIKLFDDECAIRRKHLERDLESQIERLKFLKSEEETWQDKIAKSSKEQLELIRVHEAMQSEIMNLQKTNEKIQSLAADQQTLVNTLKTEKSKLEIEIADGIKVRENENAKVHALRKQLKEERQLLEQEVKEGRGRIQTELANVRDKESRDIQRMRIEELQKIESLRDKAVEEIVQNKAMFKIKLSEKLMGLFLALQKQDSSDIQLPALKTEIFNMVQGAVEEQSFDMTQKHEGDIQHLVKKETQKRKSTVKRLGLAAGVAAAVVAGLYVSQGGSFAQILLGKNSQGESGAEEFGRQQREQREQKKFEPPQSDFIKSNYTDNVLYTRNYYTVYTNPQIQEEWITLLNGLFSKEFNLEDDAIVKFVAAESTLVTKLQQEKDQVVPDFAQLGIDKMRKVEKEQTEQMRAILKDSSKNRKFQSLSEKFWHEKLQSRLPSSH